MTTWGYRVRMSDPRMPRDAVFVTTSWQSAVGEVALALLRADREGSETTVVTVTMEPREETT